MFIIDVVIICTVIDFGKCVMLGLCVCVSAGNKGLTCKCTRCVKQSAHLNQLGNSMWDSERQVRTDQNKIIVSVCVCMCYGVSLLFLSMQPQSAFAKETMSFVSSLWVKQSVCIDWFISFDGFLYLISHSITLYKKMEITTL